LGVGWGRRVWCGGAYKKEMRRCLLNEELRVRWGVEREVLLLNIIIL
jgi:hypothetical protein